MRRVMGEALHTRSREITRCPSMERWIDQEIDRLAGDTASGATELTRRAASLLGRLVTRSRSMTAGELLGEVRSHGAKIVQAQPSMTPLYHLVRAVLDALLSEGSIADARENALRALDAFVDHLEAAPRQIAHHLLTELPQRVAVLTHSRSDTVVAALTQAASAGKEISVVVTESRPQLEGRTVATLFHRAGIATTLIVDAAAARLMPAVDVVVVGADSVCTEGVINKIGTRMIALAARERGVPVYVLAATSKFRPRGLPPLDLERNRPPEEVWDAPPGDLSIWNQYFELTPFDAITRVITERGSLGPSETMDALCQQEELSPLW